MNIATRTFNLENRLKGVSKLIDFEFTIFSVLELLEGKIL